MLDLATQPLPPRPAQTRRARPVVCHVVHGLAIGGAEVLVDRLVRRLADQYRFVVACLDFTGELGDELARDGFAVHQLGRQPGFDLRSVRRLVSTLRQEQATIVHAHQYTPFAYSAATRTMGGRPRILFTEHGRFFPDYASRKRKFFNRVMTRRHDRIVAVGASVRGALVEHEGLPARRIEVVYNGVDLSRPQTDAATRRAVREELGVADDEFIVMQVARLDAIKDHGTALRAVAAAVERKPRMKLFLIGDGPERSSIEREIAKLQLSRGVTVLGLRRDVPRLLAGADAFLLTSLSEGIPVTIIEAMAAGLPVVATAVGGVTEVVDDGASGLLARAGDAVGLADALRRLADDPGLRARLTESGRRQVELKFSEEKMIDRYANIYSEMLGDLASRKSPFAARRGEARTTSPD